MVALKTEYLRWKAYWLRQPAVDRLDRVVASLHAAANAVNLGTYPIITVMLRIFATKPVTTASGERSFTSLKYIKNYLRSTINEVRSTVSLKYISTETFLLTTTASLTSLLKEIIALISINCPTLHWRQRR